MRSKHFIAHTSYKYLTSWILMVGILLFSYTGGYSQSLEQLHFNGRHTRVAGVTVENGVRLSIEPMPLFTIVINDSLIQSTTINALNKKSASDIQTEITLKRDFNPGIKTTVTFHNTGSDTAILENMVPFGQQSDHIYITASGPPSLTRTKLFRPGKSPVGVILPDNAWEMGYGAFPIGKNMSLASIARRTGHEKAKIGRWETRLLPNGKVTYTIYADLYRGSWQQGLKLMFQNRYLYDLKKFDNSLYRRSDLKWIRDKYLIVLQMAWDRALYNTETNQYRLSSFLEKMQRLAGGIGVYGIWPTWPRLGLDQRNQWQLYRDLPGGLDRLNRLSDSARAQGTRFFISYNPWDKSTHQADAYSAMASLIEKISADGVVLDTRGKSSNQLQSAADSVRKGVVMYSEGMAVPKHMPGIVAGRVHNAIRMPPVLNLNKLIKPRFSIFRVGDPGDGPLRRGLSLSLFNGYGYEFNLFRPDRPSWLTDAYTYAGKIARVLRGHSPYFNSPEWTPLLDSPIDSVWINEWPHPERSGRVFTVFSLRPRGYDGRLIPVDTPALKQFHYVDIWEHRELQVDSAKRPYFVNAQLASFNKSWLNTRKEGAVTAIAQYPRLLNTRMTVDTLHIKTNQGRKIKIWAGNPTYGTNTVTIPARDTSLCLTDHFGFHEGKYTIQLQNRQGFVLDERVTYIKPGNPRLVHQPSSTPVTSVKPPEMKKIPAGKVSVQLSNRETFIPYPDSAYTTNQWVDRFYMDTYPVTNAEFKKFIDATGYHPKYDQNFLKHWNNGSIPAGKKDHPVVWVNLADARAYAEWAGKRLPTEMEWQRAAQGDHYRKWPWGVVMDSTYCNTNNRSTTPVDAHPKGASPYGVEDLVGNIWQLTGDVYKNASYTYSIIRGGSYYNPTSSWWYVEGGPQPLNKTQMLLYAGPGLNRNATVGFRLVKDRP